MNDQTDMMVVLFIFFVAISYMNFLSIRLKDHSGWNNVTCNPLKLFSNSLFQTQEESNKDFHRCIVKLSTEATTNLFKDQTKLQKDVLLEQSNIRNNYTELNKDVDVYKNLIVRASSDYSKIAGELSKEQKVATDVSTETSTQTTYFLTKIREIFDTIRGFI